MGLGRVKISLKLPREMGFTFQGAAFPFGVRGFYPLTVKMRFGARGMKHETNHAGRYFSTFIVEEPSHAAS
mgnify:FL=1